MELFIWGFCENSKSISEETDLTQKIILEFYSPGQNLRLSIGVSFYNLHSEIIL